jgi:hypothetical protein
MTVRGPVADIEAVCGTADSDRGRVSCRSHDRMTGWYPRPTFRVWRCTKQDDTSDTGYYASPVVVVPIPFIAVESVGRFPMASVLSQKFVAFQSHPNASMHGEMRRHGKLCKTAAAPRKSGQQWRIGWLPPGKALSAEIRCKSGLRPDSDDALKGSLTSSNESAGAQLPGTAMVKRNPFGG